MNAHHKKAAHWVGKGIFDGLTSFTEFESRVNDLFEEKDRGDVFEIFDGAKHADATAFGTKSVIHRVTEITDTGLDFCTC
jgi:hypothetical protein